MSRVEHEESMSPEERALYAYHDGELAGIARWRFERRLARSPELRRELELLRSLGGLVREGEADLPAPDLWDRIALRLPAAEAERAEARTRPRRALLGGLLAHPVRAAAVAAAAVVVLAYGLLSGDTAPRAGVVRWVDSGDRSVLVLESRGEDEATIIWLLDGGSADARGGSIREVV